MTPPFKTPSNASYFFSGFHCATTSPPVGSGFEKLRICNPSGFAGPQPQQALFGAYFSCRDCHSLWKLVRVQSRVLLPTRSTFEFAGGRISGDDGKSNTEGAVFGFAVKLRFIAADPGYGRNACPT